MVILFDLDGTLIDSTPAILESFEVAFKTFGDSVPNEEKIKELIGYPLEYMFEKLGAKDVEKYVTAYKAHYRKISTSKTTLLPFAKEAIVGAYEFATLGIVTTKTARYSKELLEHLKVMKYFDVLIGREDVVNPKPHAEPILKAIHKLNANKETTFMIGDTCLDIESSKEAGVKSIAVLSGYASEEKLKKCAKIIKKDALEAIEFIKLHSRDSWDFF